MENGRGDGVLFCTAQDLQQKVIHVHHVLKNKVVRDRLRSTLRRSDIRVEWNGSERQSIRVHL
jgi:hypothetical protein